MWDEDRPKTRQGAWKFVVFGVAFLAVTVAGFFGYERLSLMSGQDEVTTGTGPIDPFLKFQMPGISRPSTIMAEASSLRPDEEVIGFEVGGRARAYRLDALRDRSKHIVNDFVGGIPVTVAYCDIDDCVRGFTDPGRTEPLEVSAAGLYEAKEMVLEVGGKFYFQKSGAPLNPSKGQGNLPLEQLVPKRTTWSEWKRAHPQTDVYEGLR